MSKTEIENKYRTANAMVFFLKKLQLEMTTTTTNCHRHHHHRHQGRWRKGGGARDTASWAPGIMIFFFFSFLLTAHWQSRKANDLSESTDPTPSVTDLILSCGIYLNWNPASADPFCRRANVSMLAERIYEPHVVHTRLVTHAWRTRLSRLPDAWDSSK